jgi:hypothetical protein
VLLAKFAEVWREHGEELSAGVVHHKVAAS